MAAGPELQQFALTFSGSVGRMVTTGKADFKSKVRSSMHSLQKNSANAA